MASHLCLPACCVCVAPCSASQMGLNTFRAWAHSSDPRYPFQTSPGVYAPGALEALDAVLDLASRHRLHVTLSFADNWCVVSCCAWSDAAAVRGSRVSVRCLYLPLAP